MQLWAPRLLLAALVASAAVWLPAFDHVRGRDRFRLHFSFASSLPGSLHLSRDHGFGSSPLGDLPIAGAPSAVELRPYEIALPPGRYASWDIHAPVGTRFTLANVRIVDVAAGHEYPVVLSEAASARGAAIERLDADSLSGRATSADAAPQIHLAPAGATLLAFDADEIRRLLGSWLIWFGLSALVVWGMDAWLADRPGGRAITAWCRARPVRFVLGAALVGTLAATYPLFAGRSLVTPRNGPAAFVYDGPPTGYLFEDMGVERGRAPDVLATMWTVLHYRIVQTRALAQGEFPWWNRYNHLGIPLWGQGQSFMLDPLHLVSLLWSDVALGADIKFVLSRVVFAAGVALAALTAGTSCWAASLVSVAAVFNGHFIGWLNHPASFSLQYAPWILVGYFLLIRADTTRRRAGAGTLIAAASALLIYASPPKEALALELCAHVAGLVSLALAPKSGDRIRLFGVALAAGCAAVLLSAPSWLIFLDTLAQAATFYDRPRAALADMTALMTFMTGAFSSRQVYAALSPLITAFIAIGLLSPARIPAAVAGASVGGAMGLGLAFGLVPIDTLVSVPLVANIQRIGEVFLNAASVPLLIVAAWGVDQARARPLLLVSGPGSALRLSVFTAAAAGLGLLVIATGDFESPFLGLSVVSVAAAFCLPFLLGASGPRIRAVPAAALAALAVLLLAPGGLHLETGIPMLDERLVQPRGRERLERASPSIARLQQEHDPFRVAPAGMVMQGGIPGLFGLEGVTGGDALWIPELNDLAERFQASRFPWSFLASASGPERQRLDPLMDVLNVRYVLAADRSGDPADPLLATERHTAWPRAFFADRVEVHEGPRGFTSRIVRDTSIPFASIDAVDRTAMLLTESLRGTATTTVRATGYRLTANSTSFTVLAPAAGVVVLNETYLRRDVVAEVDGQPAVPFRVNHLMRGVVVPAAGTWTIRFHYRPARLQVALWMAASGALLMALPWVVALCRDRSPRAVARS